MAIKREQERITAGIDTLEEGTHAEAHHASTGTREVLKILLIYLACFFSLFFINILRESVTRKLQFLHYFNHLFTIKACILIVDLGLELQCTRYAVREVTAVTVVELEIFASVLRIRFGIVLLDEGAGTANEEEFHQVTPVFCLVALLKGTNATDKHFVVLHQELTFTTDCTDVLLWTNTQIHIRIEEEF